MLYGGGGGGHLIKMEVRLTVRERCYKVPVISQAKDEKGKELIKKIYSSHVLNYEKIAP